MPGADFRGANLRGAGLAERRLGSGPTSEAPTSATPPSTSARPGAGWSAARSPREGSRTGFYTDDFNDQDFKSPEEIRKANLRGANLRGATIDGVDFYLVDLRDARVDPAQVAHLRRCRGDPRIAGLRSPWNPSARIDATFRSRSGCPSPRDRAPAGVRLAPGPCWESAAWVRLASRSASACSPRRGSLISVGPLEGGEIVGPTEGPGWLGTTRGALDDRLNGRSRSRQIGASPGRRRRPG